MQHRCQGRFAQWGWRIPFWVSVILLVFSVYIRLKLEESPVFKKMKRRRQGLQGAADGSFLRYPNNKFVLLALLGATAGQGVVWYTGQFYALFFLMITLKLDYVTTYMLIGISLMIGTPFFIFFGWLSDRIGRHKIIMAGCLIAALTYFPLFQGLTHYVNPALEAVSAEDARSRSRRPTATSTSSSGHGASSATATRPRTSSPSRGSRFSSLPGVDGKTVVTKIGDVEIEGLGREETSRRRSRQRAIPGRPTRPRSTTVMTLLILVILVIYVTMVYGPIAAFLVELFPTRIRYTSMSLPYHIGNGWFGGMLPLTATAMVAATGDIYYGLWYPIVVAAMTLVVGILFLKETKDRECESTSTESAALLHDKGPLRRAFRLLAA